jgi:hypothetical protein
MKSVRFDVELEARLDEAVRLTGRPASTIIRDAVRRRCDELLSRRLRRRLADVVGAVNSGGGKSRRTGKTFAALLKNRRRAKP